MRKRAAVRLKTLMPLDQAPATHLQRPCFNAPRWAVLVQGHRLIIVWHRSHYVKMCHSRFVEIQNCRVQNCKITEFDWSSRSMSSILKEQWITVNTVLHINMLWTFQNVQHVYSVNVSQIVTIHFITMWPGWNLLSILRGIKYPVTGHTGANCGNICI